MAEAILGIDTLWGGDVMCASGTGRFIADSWFSDTPLPDAYTHPTAAQVRASGGVSGKQVDKAAIQAYLNAVDVRGAIRGMGAEAKKLASELRLLTGRVDQQVDGVSGNLVATLKDLQTAASSLSGATGEFEQILGELEQPVDDFAATGLYEFTQLIGETRLLVAALSRITKEFERDPAGFLIGRTVRGYEPE